MRLFFSWTSHYRDTYGERPTQLVFNQYLNHLLQSNPEYLEHYEVYSHWISALFASPMENTDFVIEEVRTFVAEQEYKIWLQKSKDLLASGDKDAIAQIKEHYDTLNMSLSQSAAAGDDVLDPFEASYDELFGSPLRDTLDSDWAQLDKYTGGAGLKELFVWIAPTGTGKSWAMSCQGAAALKRGKFVLHITLEMDRKIVAHRYYSILTGAVMNDLPTNPDAVKQAKGIVAKNGGMLRVKSWAAGTVRVSDVRDLIAAQEATVGRKVDMVIVDYADLLKADERNKNNQVRHELSDIYVGLRAIAQKKSLAMITASQANKEALNKEVVTIANLAEAFSKAHHSDVMVALCQTKEEEESNRMRFFIAKNRNNPKAASIKLMIDYARGVMAEVGSIAVDGQPLAGQVGGGMLPGVAAPPQLSPAYSQQPQQAPPPIMPPAPPTPPTQ